MEIAEESVTLQSVPAPRLHVPWARAAKVAVLLRRGPSKWVEVIRWDTAQDTLERGHWFHGRIYERRCDLSPDGDLFVYFASKITGRTIADSAHTHAWTAVSRPPWLTALALWPRGDCWHGGGLFTGERRLRLNHRPQAAHPHPNHRPKGLTIVPDPSASGEDDPLFGRRLTRDGWTLLQEWNVDYRGLHERYVTVAPEIRERYQRGRTTGPGVRLSRRIDRLSYREHSNSSASTTPRLFRRAASTGWTGTSAGGWSFCRTVAHWSHGYRAGTSRSSRSSQTSRQTAQFRSLRRPRPHAGSLTQPRANDGWC
jgi:hypothetical protein